MHRYTRMIPFGFVIRCKTTCQENNRHVAATCTLTDFLTQLEAIQRDVQILLGRTEPRTASAR